MAAPPSSRLADPRLPWLAAVLAAVLTLPSLAVGWVQDDLSLRALALDRAPLLGPHAPWDLFRFYSDPEVVQRMQQVGLIPWWGSPELRLAFFRPLSSLWHAADFRLLPAAAQHLESVGLYAAVAWLVARLYRQIEPDARLAGLAGLLWAIDDAHGMPVGWLANRNAVLAWGLGALALGLHDRWRRLGWAPGALLAPLAAAAGLLAGEAALGIWGYLLAHALFLDRGSASGRIRALLPYGAMLAAWRAAYQLGGYGTAGSAFYVDPGREPLAFLTILPVRVLALLGALAGPVPADLGMVLPSEGRVVLYAVLAAIAAIAAAAVADQLRSEPLARFYALGAVLATVPFAATWPSERLLALAGIGAFGLAARLWTRSRRAAIAIGLVHVGLAVPLLPLRSVAVAVPAADQRLAGATLPRSAEVVVVSAPDWFVPIFGAQEAAAAGARPADALRLLTCTPEPLAVERPDESTLILRSEAGFLRDALSLVPRDRPFAEGTAAEIGGWRFEVRKTDGRGHPTAIEVRSPGPLEAPDRAWTTWVPGQGFVPFALPPAELTRGAP